MVVSTIASLLERGGVRETAKSSSTHIADALQRLPPPAPFHLRKIPTLLVNLDRLSFASHLPRNHLRERPLLLLLSRLPSMRLNCLRLIWEPNLKTWPPTMKI
jgi:hypothetical protein